MRLLHLLFDICTHADYTWPRRAEDGSHYVRCIRCLTKIPYDWDEMRIQTHGVDDSHKGRNLANIICIGLYAKNTLK